MEKEITIKLTFQQQISETKFVEIESGLDFILSHFDKERLFPRTIQTHVSKGKQIEIFSKEEIIEYFAEADFVDCRINAFPSYTEYKGVQRYPPNFIFIDIDRNNFKDDKSFENALSTTLKNIKRKLNGTIPSVNWSGNGYHIIQPIECPILEQIEQFQKYNKPSEQFLRFTKDYLSNGKADSGHHPSFKSCQIRVPGSINSKCLDNRDKRLSGNFRVKTLQKWNGVRSPIPIEFVKEFRRYLIQKEIDEYNNNYKQRQKILLKLKGQNKNKDKDVTNRNYYEWIDKMILANPFSDYRKIIVNLILAPYLIVIKKLSVEESYQIINEWLQKCGLLRKIDFNTRSFVNTALATAYKKQIPPMSITTLKTNYNDLYLLLIQKGKEGEIREG